MKGGFLIPPFSSSSCVPMMLSLSLRRDSCTTVAGLPTRVWRVIILCALNHHHTHPTVTALHSSAQYTSQYTGWSNAMIECGSYALSKAAGDLSRLIHNRPSPSKRLCKLESAYGRLSHDGPKENQAVWTTDRSFASSLV